MPRNSKNSRAPAHTLVLDLGASYIKAGLTTSEAATCIPNVVARDASRKSYVGNAISKCSDKYHLLLRRPMERGMVTDWEAERAIWYSSFLSGDADVPVVPQETSLILAESTGGTFPALLHNLDQVVFEEMEFEAYYRVSGARLNAWHTPESRFMVLVDSGYSHTTVTPMVDGKIIHSAVRRLDIGGKHLSNYLVELLAIREISLKEDPWIANELKEKVCFVSQQFNYDVERTWRGHVMHPDIAIDVQLPDYQTYKEVIIKPWQPVDQVIKNKANIMAVGNERFQVPEILFNPSDIGMTEAGLPEVIMQSITSLPVALQPAMYENIFVVGGNVNLPGFVDRLTSELRQLVPSDCHLKVSNQDDPVSSTWAGGVKFANNQALLKENLVSRHDYQENGSNWLYRKFDTDGD